LTFSIPKTKFPEKMVQPQRLGWLWENKGTLDKAQQSKPAAGIIKNKTAKSSDFLLKPKHAERYISTQKETGLNAD